MMYKKAKIVPFYNVSLETPQSKNNNKTYFTQGALAQKRREYCKSILFWAKA